MITKLVGNDDKTFSTDMVKDYILYQSFTAISTGILSEIRIKASASGNAKVAIYANNAGAPGSLLASSASSVVSTGWNTIAVGPISIDSDTIYWLAYNSETDGSVNTIQTGGSSKYKSISFASAFPDPATYDNSSTRDLPLAGWGTIAAISHQKIRCIA